MKKEFNGQRLKEARLYNKMSITTLAERLQVTKQMISKYENGKSEPTTEKSLKLHDILNYPREFFYTSENYSYTSQGTFFRSRITATKKSKQPAEFLLKYALVIRAFLDEYVEFPKLLDISNKSFDNNPENCANLLRTILELGELPINDMLELMETIGIVVVKLDYSEKKVDAFSCTTILNNRHYFAVVTGNKQSFFRQQFSLAHELGHWFLHQDYNPQELDKEEYKLMEKEANHFAASFLMPAHSFGEDLKKTNLSLESLITLKHKWNVSLSSIIERGYQLEIISSDKRSNLYRKMNYHNFRKVEPLDLETPIPEPLALSQAIELLIEENIMSGFEIRKKIMDTYNLYITQDMMADVCNVSPYTFSPKNSINLKLKVKNYFKDEKNN